MKFILSFLLLFSFLCSDVFALAVDEKLTLRVIKISESRKTILINRGIEDGLQEGDHAKFFLTVGVVARGVVVKASPTRTVWSLYRLVNADYIRDDQVMNLKITPAVKITQDESRMLVDDDTPRATSVGVGDPRDLGIPLAEGADDLTEEDKLNRAKDATARLEFDESFTDIRSKNLEVFGTVYFSSLTSGVKSDGGREFSANDDSTNVTVGGEYYFTKDPGSWLSSVSIGGAASIGQRSLQSHSGDTVKSNSTDFIGMLNIHILRKPFEVYRILPFLHLSGGMGSVKTEYAPGGQNSSGAQAIEGSASSMLLSFGAGLKYYTPSGFGARVIFDYFSRQDKFAEDVNKEIWTKTQNGPRFYMGLGYRF